jgi:hypothetical protein
VAWLCSMYRRPVKPALRKAQLLRPTDVPVTQIDSSTLHFCIDTPNKQYAEVDFDLQTLR